MSGDGHESGMRRREAPFFGNVPAVVTALAGAFAVVFVILWIVPSGREALISAQYGLSPERLVLGAKGPGGWPGAMPAGRGMALVRP